MFSCLWIRSFAAVALLYAGLSFGAAEGFKVTTDQTVDSSSLENIVKDVMRLSGAKTNDEKAIAIYNYLHSAIFHHEYAIEKAPQNIGPLKLLNVYGWSLCGGQHTVLKALFETAGFQVRYRGWSKPGHTTVECNYDGKWHYLDVFLKCYYWTKDKKTLAGQDDIIADASVVLDAEKDGRVPKESYLCCGDGAKGVVLGCNNSKANAPSKPEQGWASVTGRDQNYSPLLKLPSGAALKLEWSGLPEMMVANGAKGIHSCPSLKDVRNNPVLGPIEEHYGTRSYSNGSFCYQPDFNKAGDVADVELTNVKADKGALVADGAGVALFKLELPYPYASAKIDATFTGDGKLSVSSDGGKTWQASAAGDVSPLVRQHYKVWLKAEFSGSLNKFKVNGIVEHNRYVLPYLINGKNTITVALDNATLPPDTVLQVTYSYQETTGPEGRKNWNGVGLTYGEIKTVVKEISTVPFTFEVEIGGVEPPKMISFERAVKSKGL